MDLLFERFLSPARDGYPDIDLDIESDRREEVIQYVYQTLRAGLRRAGRQRDHLPAALGGARHRQGAGLLARPAGRVEQADRALGRRDPPCDGRCPQQVGALATQLLGFPRHLGIHSGGMVICDRPVSEVVPVEWARMADRSVVQWDKDDCAYAGLVKFDLLGLGMLTALHLMIDLVARAHRREDRAARAAGHRPGRLRDAAAGRLGRGVPGGVPRPDGHAAPAASRASSTTWSSRSR